jgi:hypothetical protein
MALTVEIFDWRRDDIKAQNIIRIQEGSAYYANTSLGTAIESFIVGDIPFSVENIRTYIIGKLADYNINVQQLVESDEEFVHLFDFVLKKGETIKW